MENESDNIPIYHVENATWLKTVIHYPRTVGQMKLLISIVDKMGIFNKFNLNLISQMSGHRLNILYAVLRIINKLFNKYSDYVVKKIFIDKLKQIFISVQIPNYANNYELFMED